MFKLYFKKGVIKIKLFGLEFKWNGFDIWHKGNMGAGSGLDADKLDGKEGSYYDIPFVVGSQTTTTSAWTGNADNLEVLINGTSIRYWLPRTSTSTSVTLNLTLKDGSTTGAIPCYYGGTSRLTTHYSAGSFITLTYIVNQDINGTLYTGWWAGANYTDGNTYDRTYWGNTITAGETICDYKLIMQGLDGKFYPLTLESGTGTTKTISTQEFEVNSTILYYASTTDIAVGGTLTNVYSEIPLTISYTANQSSWTSQQNIYLKGIILPNGNFKLDNTSYTSFMTQTLPTEPDGFVYVLLGYMYSTTAMRLFQYHPMYEFRDGYLRVYAVIHSHGNITDDGRIGSTDNLAVMTTTGGIITTGTLPVSTGGTGATSASDALINFGLTATATEINYIDGVTSNIQTQLNSKAPLTSPTFTGTVVAPTFSGALSGNSSTATKLSTARTFTLSGDVSGSATFDGSTNPTITTTVVDDSHNHIISNVDNLQTALDAKTPFSTLSATIPATSQWYRIATSAVNIGANAGLFKVDFSGTGVRGSALFRASCHDGIANGTNINQIGFSSSNLTLGLTQVRVVYHTTATGNYAYVEIFNPTALAITYTVDLIDATGWSLVTPSTVGSIPTGYISESLVFGVGIVSGEDVTVKGKINLPNSSIQYNSTTNCIEFIFN